MQRKIITKLYNKRNRVNSEHNISNEPRFARQGTYLQRQMAFELDAVPFVCAIFFIFVFFLSLQDLFEPQYQDFSNLFTCFTLFFIFFSIPLFCWLLLLCIFPSFPIKCLVERSNRQVDACTSKFCNIMTEPPQKPHLLHIS